MIKEIKEFISRLINQESKVTELEERVKKLENELFYIQYHAHANSHEGRYTQERRSK